MTSDSSQRIAILLSDRLTNVKNFNSKSRTICWEEFDTILQKFDVVSDDKMLTSQKIGLLKKAMNTDIQFLQAWAAVETVIYNIKSNTTTSYEEYLDYLVAHSEKLEESSTDNLGQQANVAETYFMESYLPNNTHYEKQPI